jgi:hypothetical protein
VGRLLACWPKPAGEKPYFGALAAALRNYPRRVALAAADPVTGIPRETKFQPTVADVIAWCERESGWMRRAVERQNLDHARAKERAEAIADQRRTEEARKLRPTLEELRRKHGPNWGLKSVDSASGMMISPGLLDIMKKKPGLENKDDDWGP